MLALALSVLKFLQGNWRWLVPALVVVVLGGWIGILKIENADLRAKVANAETEKLAVVAEALRLQKQAHDEDARNNDALVTALRIDRATITKELSDAQRKIRATTSSTVCINTDAARAFRDSLRRAPDTGQTGTVQPGPPTGRTDKP